MFCFSLNCSILFSFTDVFEAKYVLLWTYLRIVQEKVALSSPRVPHTSIRGGRIIPKEKAHTVKIISRMFSREQMWLQRPWQVIRTYLSEKQKCQKILLFYGKKRIIIIVKCQCMNKIISLHCVLEVLSFCSNGPCPSRPNLYIDAKVYHYNNYFTIVCAGSHDMPGPIRGQYSGHVTSINQ